MVATPKSRLQPTVLTMTAGTRYQNPCGFEVELHGHSLQVGNAVLTQQAVEFIKRYGAVRACFQAAQSVISARSACLGRKPAPSFLDADFVIR
jgi:hypothetical protein